MSRWSQGAQEIEQLLARRHLERVRGARADGTPWLEKARRRLETAEAIAVDDPESVFVLTYDAARFVGEALFFEEVTAAIVTARNLFGAGHRLMRHLALFT